MSLTIRGQHIGLAANDTLAHPMHVKTPAGAKWYHQPIGSLIYAKPHPHELEPHERLIYVGSKAYAVPAQAEVYTPGSVDQHDDAAVAHASKLIRLGPGGKFARLSPVDGLTTFTESPAWGPGLNGWKLLPVGEQKVPVTIQGKLAAWVPPDWKLYGVPQPPVSGIWAKKPDGHWVSIGQFGFQENKASQEEIAHWAASGEIVPWGPSGPLPSGAVPPSPASPPGHAAPKVDVGGVSVSQPEVASAIQILTNDKSTAIKQPLAKAGHPLAASDYHAVVKAELAAHPELKVPKGTKAKHVGQAKIAYLHHLGAKHSALAATMAEQAAAEQAAAQAQAQAEHAQAVAGGTYSIGGVHATKEQVEAAIAALEATKATAIKQTLKAKGNPLQAADYWAVVHAQHEKSYASSKKGAKGAFIDALKEAIGQPATSAPATPAAPPPADTSASELHDLIDSTAIPVKEWNLHMLAGFGDVNGALAGALIMAHSSGKTQWVAKGPPNPAKFHVYGVKPAADHYWVVTPEHTLTFHAPGGESTITPDLVLGAFKAGVGQFAQPVPAPAAGPAPAPEPAPEPFTAKPGWDTLHELVAEGHGPTLTGAVNQGTAAVLAYMLQKTSAEGKTLYVRVPAGSKYPDLPVPVKPPLGQPGHNTGYHVYEVGPDHHITWWDSAGNEDHYLISQVSTLASKWIKKDEPPPSITVGTQQVTAAQIHDAISLLEGTANTWVLKVLKAAENPLGQGTWGVFKEWHIAHPEAGSAKPAFIAWLKSLLPAEAKPSAAKPAFEEETAKYGEPSVTVKPVPAEPAGPSDDEVLAKAIQHAAKNASAGGLQEKLAKAIKLTSQGGSPWDKPAYVKPLDNGTGWVVNTLKPPKGAKETYYEVTGTKVTFYTDLGATSHLLSNADTMLLLEQGFLGLPPDEQTGPPIPVVVKHKVVGEAPAGTKFYTNLSQSWDTAVYLALPSGEWLKATPYSSGFGSFHKVKQTWGETMLASGKLKELAPATPELVAQLKEAEGIKEMLKDGSVDPEAKPGDDDPGALAYQIATAATRPESPSGTVYIWRTEAGAWKASNWAPYDVDHLYKIDLDTFTGAETHPGESDTPIPFGQVKAAIQQWVTPNSVLVAGKQFKYGHYYKKSGAAHLEIHGGYSSYKSGGGSKAAFKWHGKDGSAKDMTPHAAMTWLTSGDPQHHEAEKPAVLPTSQVAQYATTFKPGAWYPVHHPGLAEPGQLEVMPDGSAVYTHSGSYQTKDLAEVAELLGSGQVVDSYGTTVVKPGVTPDQWYLFGPHPYSASQLKQVIAKLESDPQETPADALGIYAHDPGSAEMLQFFMDKGATTGGAQHDALHGLLTELLAVPENKAAPAEVTYLKSLPPGIHGPKDVFAFDDLGYAKPPFWGDGDPGTAGATKVFNPWTLTAAEQAAKIKEISQQFGGGKVIGTHISGLTKDEKAQWLEAFKLGDMVAVFNLDAKGGKVSPAHPGAPKHDATHTVIWGPWGAGETPAGKDIEGDWSDHTKVTLPKAEIDNYILKAGLKHAEFLDWSEKRAWVTWHRKHNQPQVDLLSRLASDRYHSGASTLTGPPVWTDNIQPAKSYDVFLEDKTQTSSWPLSALEDFLADYAGQVAPWVKEVQQQYGFSSANVSNWASSAQRMLAQHYLDDLAAKELAEKLKPKYHTVTEMPGGAKAVADQHGWKGWWQPADETSRGAQLAIATLAKLWGFKTPETRHAVVDGEDGIAHADLSPDNWLSSASTTKLSQRQLEDIAREHVFDWAIGNAYSSPGHIALMSDGSAVGTEKTQAFKEFGTWQGLDLAQMDHFAEQSASRLYQAVISHQLTRKQADAAYRAALLAAQRMSRLPDERLGQVLGVPGWLADEQRAAVTARKNKLAEDFQQLWAEVYAKAGWKLPPMPKERLRFGLHSGFSEPTFFDHVMAAKSFGATAFFGGTDLDDGSFLVWTELGGPGKDAPRLIRGESHARGQALAALTAWSEAHQQGGPQNITAPADPNAPKSEASFYKNIIAAAKAVSRHAADQMWEGPYTKTALERMEHDKGLLQQRLAEAEEAIAAGPDSPQWASVLAARGHPELVKSMAAYYLDQISQIEQRKQDHLTFQPGDLPQWVAPKIKDVTPAKPKPKVKVELKSAIRELGPGGEHALDPGDGELHLTGATHTYPGKVWRITLPTGEVIEFSNEAKTSSAKAHIGRIRFKADATKGSASLERIRAQLQEMGLPLPEAEEHDMELLYWRHLAFVLANRKDTHSHPHSQVWEELALAVSKLDGKLHKPSSSDVSLVRGLIAAGLPPEEELAIWRKAWATQTSPAQVQQFVDKGGYLPHFKHWDITSPDTPNGKPVWFRFDADPKYLATKRLSHQLKYPGSQDALKVARTGGAHSTEARLRALGIWVPGMSSETDMLQHGSSGVLYLRTNYALSHGHLKIHPKTFAQTTTYGFDKDGWGDVDERKTHSYFSLKNASSLSGNGTNETDIKDGASLLDDIEVLQADSAHERDQIIKELKAHGITHIRGAPVEDRVVTGSAYTAAAEKAQQLAKDNAVSWFDHPSVVWTPPPSGVVTHGEIETEAEEGAGEAASEGPAKQVAGAAATTDHSEAAQESHISQMFYGTKTKPSKHVIETQGMDKAAKKTASSRVAKAMTSTDEEVSAMLADSSLGLKNKWGDTEREQLTSALIKEWASSNSTPLMVAMHEEAEQLFGLTNAKVTQLDGAFQFDYAAAKVIQDKYGPVIRDFLRSMWTLTQEDLSKNGLDKITLHRIMKWSGVPSGAMAWAKGLKVGDKIKVPAQRPIASWGYIAGTAGVKGAGIFGKGNHHVMVRATFPRQAALTYPKTGFGSFNEVEFTMLNVPGEWEVVEVG
jgi:hypothetical protein